MALLTNKLDATLSKEAFDARYDIFEVTKEGGGRLSWSSRVLEPFGAAYILAILGQGGDKPFYILAPKGAVTAKQLRAHFEKSYNGEICDEGLEAPDVAQSLLPKRVSSESVSQDVLVQLLMNALYAENGAGEASLQNVTGHLYCFKTGPDWVKKTKDGRMYQIVALELKVTPGMLLTAKAQTFTRANASGLKFDTRKKDEYARYVVDFAGPTMRRVAPGEKPNPNDVYIQKQYEGRKNKIPFLKYKSLKAFNDTRCGVLCEAMERFNAMYEGIAHIAFAQVDDSKRLPVPKKLMEASYKKRFAQTEFVVVDAACDAESGLVCEAIANMLGDAEYLGTRPPVVRRAVAGANNLLVLHDREYYANRELEDPYAGCMVEGAACQHLTIETVQGDLYGPSKGANLRFVLQKCLMEMAVKQDICEGVMRLFDWGQLGLDSSMVFAVCGPETAEERKARKRGEAPKRFSFLEVDPGGGLSFHVGHMDNAHDGSKWDDLAHQLAGDWSPKTEGFVVNAEGDIDVIEVTDGFPVPNLGLVKSAIASIDWALPKQDVLGALSEMTGDDAYDAALRALCEWVWALPTAKVKSSKLNSLIVDASNLPECTYSSKQIRDRLDRKFEGLFALRVQTCIPRNGKAVESTYEAITKMHCYKQDNALLYWANSFEGLSQTGRDKGCVIRQVRNANGGEPFFSPLLETLAVPIARLGNPSVLPLPFKYLREWMATAKIGL